MGWSRWAATLTLAVAAFAMASEAFATQELLAFRSEPTRTLGAAAGTVGADAAERSGVPITVNAEAFALTAGDEIGLTLPDGAFHVVAVDLVREVIGGNKALHGHLRDFDQPYQVLVVSGPFASFGRLRTPDGVFSIVPGPEGDWLVPYDVSLQEVPIDAGGIVARDRGAVIEDAAKEQGSNRRPVVAAEGGVSLDIMILYTQSMVDRYGAGVTARIATVVEILNQALMTGNTGLMANVVHTQQVNYSETTSNFEALLDDLQPGASNANGDLSFVPGLRDEKGADLVTLMRAFRNPDHQNCGLAFVSGSGAGEIRTFDIAFGYNLVSDTTDVNGSNFFCSEETFAHEIGHNMGNGHDIGSGGADGVFPFSRGHKVIGEFATIMGTVGGADRIQIYSNPLQTCGVSNSPCGDPDVADVARSIGIVGPDIAAFRDAVGGPTPPEVIFAAVLPTSRSVQVGVTATAFGAIVNPNGTAGNNCRIELPGFAPDEFFYQTTTPTNQLSGTPDTPVAIPAGGVQNFVFGVTRQAPFGPTDLPLDFTCDNFPTAASQVGLNTLLFSASTDPVPDLIALAATPAVPGVVELPGATGTGAFSVAFQNVGAAGTITTSADSGGTVLPVSVSICQTGPDGLCITPLNPTQTTPIGANETGSFAIFVTGSGLIPFDPANNRIFVRFSDGGSVVRGSTSVAVRTQ